MNLEEKIAQAAMAVLSAGPVTPRSSGPAGCRSARAEAGTRSAGRERLMFESGGVPVIPPSDRREVRI